MTGGATRPGGRSAVAGFLILMTFAFFGFVQVDQQADRGKEANRESCERINVIRENQGQVLLDQIEQTDRTLRRGLGPIERWRPDIERSQRLRRRAVRQLAVSVEDFPVKGRRFSIDCERAYP